MVDPSRCGDGHSRLVQPLRRPDEFWDEEPLVAQTQASRPLPPPADPCSTPQAAAPEAVRAESPGSAPWKSTFVTIQVDSRFLPVRIDLSRQWSRYVEPAQVADELMRAYRGAVADRVTQDVPPKRPHRQPLRLPGMVPSRRQMTMLLLEAETWDEYQLICSTVVGGGAIQAVSREQDHGCPVVAVTADRMKLKSLVVQPSWVSRVEPMRIVDEVLRCCEEIRSVRPDMQPKNNYSRYSDEDLEFHRARHHGRLYEERIRYMAPPTSGQIVAALDQMRVAATDWGDAANFLDEAARLARDVELTRLEAGVFQLAYDKYAPSPGYAGARANEGAAACREVSSTLHTVANTYEEEDRAGAHALYGLY